MNVALDATPLTVSTGGIRRYTAELSRALASEFPGDTFHLLSDQPFSLDGGLPTNLKKGRAPSGGRPRPLPPPPRRPLQAGKAPGAGRAGRGRAGSRRP